MKLPAATLTVLLSTAFVACVTVVQPPLEPHQKRPVFLLVLGNHSNLVLADSNGRLTRYAYGDWQWYALDNTSWWRGAAALLWPTTAAVGRRELRGPATAENVRRQVPLQIDQLHRLEVSGTAVDALQIQLDALFRQASRTPRYRPDYELEFVEHPVPYTARHNSNHVVAQWLKQLGCEVDGGYLLTRWRIVPPREDR